MRLLGGRSVQVTAKGWSPPPAQFAHPLRGEGELSILFAQRTATASSGCRGGIFSTSDSEIGTCTLEFHFLKGERPRFFCIPLPLPSLGRRSQGRGGEEARRNLNVSSFWLHFAEGRLGPRAICRFNSEISVDATNPRKPHNGQGGLGG